MERLASNSTPERPEEVSARVAYFESGAHLRPLDGVRGCAILLVLIYHQTVMNEITLVDSVYIRLTELFRCGVDLFFVLSGFLITGILLRTKDRPRYFSTFYIRRALRIFPLYYALVIFSLVILPHFAHAKSDNFARIQGDEFWYWTLLSNYSVALSGKWRHSILDVTWSLAIEEQFYIVWPFVVWCCSGRALRTLCCLLIFVAWASRCWLWAMDINENTIYTLTFTRFDGLAVGSLLASCFHEQKYLSFLQRWALPAALFLWGCILALWFAWWDPGKAFGSPLFLFVGVSLIVFSFGFFVAAAALAAPESRLYQSLSARWLCTFGKYSYALYLFVMPIRGIFRDFIYRPSQFPTFLSSPLPGQLLFYLITTMVTLAAAWLSWHLYEKHFLKLKPKN